MGGRRGSSTVSAGTAQVDSAGAESGTAVLIEIARTEIAAAWRHPHAQTPLLQHAKWPLAGDEPFFDLTAFMCPLQCSMPAADDCITWSMLAVCALTIGAPTTLSATASSDKKNVTLRPAIQMLSARLTACAAAIRRSSPRVS